MEPRTESEIIVEGNDLEDALTVASERLGIDRITLEYRVVDSDVGGIFGIFKKKKITIKAWRRDTDRPPLDIGQSLQEAERFLGGILDLMGIEARIAGKEIDEGLILTIDGQRDGLIIGKRGQTLDALQYIVNRYMQRDPNRKVRVILDSEGYRRRREQAIARMAQSIAKKVKRSGKPMAAQPMDSGERRLFHLALKYDRELHTESRGEGDRRKVVVYPVKK